MTNASNLDSILPEKWTDRQDKFREISVPLGMLKSGRLVFASSTSQLSLKTWQMESDLCQARFSHHVPSMRLHEDTLTIEYPHLVFSDPSVESGKPLSEIGLNNTIPWDIEFHSSVSALKADLSRLQVRSLDYLGNASRVELLLSKPAGTAFIYISGGLNQGVISRPAGVSLRIKISGSVSDLLFDDQHLGVAGGEISLESPNFSSSPDRYEICITGGANRVLIFDERRPIA